jgi:hypothetical protein
MLVLSACSLSTIGGLSDQGTGVEPTTDGAPRSDAARDTDATVDEGGARTDAGDDGGTGEDADASTPIVDAGIDVRPLPADAGPPTALVLSGRLWSYDMPADSWSGGQQLPTGGCPQLDDVAIDAYGNAYAVGNNGASFYSLNPTNVSCSQIGNNGTYPKATTFALRGTLLPFTEALVGYQDNGDYVRIDTTTGSVSVITQGAMAGFTVGDVVNVGTKGYAVLSGGACGSASCLWEVNLATGMRVGASAIGNFPGGPVTGLAHWGGKIYGFVNPDQVYRADPTNPGGASGLGGVPNYVSVQFLGAGSNPAAPTQ